jgi:hypothetical protein
MKGYDIKTFQNENKEVQYVVFSTFFISPTFFLKEIEKELSMQINEEKEIIFDLLLSSGNNSNRYGKAIYDGRKFKYKSYENISVPKKNELRKFSTQYYKEHADYVNNSILNSAQKFLIKNGVCI